MRLGIQVRTPPVTGATVVEDLTNLARAARDAGVATMWVTQAFDYDALTALAAVGAAVDGIELGTAVVVTRTRHPIALALQALTTQVALSGRLVLGIGPSHAAVVREMFGVDPSRPVEHVDEYLQVLHSVFTSGAVDVDGATLSAHAPSVSVRGAQAPPILLGAMNPKMLALAGRCADGTVTAQVGPRTLATHIVPALSSAAAAAGRPRPRVVPCVAVCVTGDPDATRAAVAAEYVTAASQPTYRTMFALEGVTGAADLAIVGDEATVERGLRRLVDAGATDVAARLVGSPAERSRTIELLGGLTTREE